MINQGVTYRSGFLLNSAELAGLVHIPSIKELAKKNIPINFLEDKELVGDSKLGSKGTLLGYNSYADKEHSIFIDCDNS